MSAKPNKPQSETPSSIKKQNRIPKYGDNYNRGYIGFTYNDSNFVSRGIAYFTGFGRMSDIITTHTLIVTGADECIEAHAQSGVQRSNLSKYFDDEQCDIFFRKPRGLSEDIATNLINRAEQELNSEYDLRLIAAHAAAGTMLGHFLNRLSQGQLEKQIAQLLNKADAWICSELIAYCLDQDPYKDQGILKEPWETISPQELFEDSLGQIFEPWRDFQQQN
ncbi:hypothetical protein [Picosynechococcus sp. NKBG042902]|uniref:hypothetical protein n=1 Tax=Picosynechococcus sp. NKBG042902 TaxID=490193 RepID=UPI0006931EF6|nr:hypothetical protein [Picosynechococcus sp. NKBG042902]